VGNRRESRRTVPQDKVFYEDIREYPSKRRDRQNLASVILAGKKTIAGAQRFFSVEKKGSYDRRAETAFRRQGMRAGRSKTGLPPQSERMIFVPASPEEIAAPVFRRCRKR
jgi:hypothetical protein